MSTKDIKLSDRTRGRIIHDNLQGIYNLAPLPEEPHFGELPCDCCKSPLAGERYRALGTAGKKHNTERIDLICCVDCFGWLFS